MLEVARRQAPTGVEAELEWRVGEAGSLPCADAEFDIVLCQQGLQFFPDREGALREMHRVLKPGGLVGICVWRAIEHSPCHFAIAEALSRHVGDDIAQRFQSPFSFGHADALIATMAGAGFSDVDVRVEIVRRRLLPPEESVPGLLASTPVGREFASLDNIARDAVIRDVAEALSSYRDNEGLKVPQPTNMAFARK